jgi:hypothetical protein
METSWSASWTSRFTHWTVGSSVSLAAVRKIPGSHRLSSTAPLRHLCLSYRNNLRLRSKIPLTASRWNMKQRGRKGRSRVPRGSRHLAHLPEVVDINAATVSGATTLYTSQLHCVCFKVTTIIYMLQLHWILSGNLSCCVVLWSRLNVTTVQSPHCVPEYPCERELR